ncbi:hypothetical protein GCWU000324_01906 [Kingella oralis ATCC 51147]|uniref:Uncharacterized protein n=1 Tax=Kingella oralis ATCC 51147 TaxID=629741 RepID=C4GIN5_9NEIS|nr:hypothetical protein GCWU000324_01906 [Kingella oralis ATCC 51147]
MVAEAEFIRYCSPSVVSESSNAPTTGCLCIDKSVFQAAHRPAKAA